MTATVAPVTGGGPVLTGSVSFYAAYVSTASPGTLLGTVNVSGTPKTAQLTLPAVVPGTQVTAVYNGDSNYASSVSPPATANTTPSCTTSYTGTLATGINVSSGVACVTNARVGGAIMVGPAATLVLSNSTVTGSLSLSGKAFVCGSTASSVLSSSATGLIVFGDPREGCRGNTILGSMTFMNDTHGLVVSGNTYKTTFTATGNAGTGPLPGDTGPVITNNTKVL
jgi:hypothetical protein